MKNNSKILLTSVFFVIALVCLALYLPFAQDKLIALVERLKNDDIRDVFWKQQMIAAGTCGLLFVAAFISVLWTEKGMSIFRDLIASLKDEAAFVVKNKRYFIFLSVLYFLGYFTVIINNFCYISADELPRQMEGYRHWVTWFRYIDEIGSIFIHTSSRLLDIAPLTQFIAIAFVSLASFMTVQSTSSKNMSYFACLASLPIGLYPYFFADFAYRFDSPYMAFSIFACVIPFVFRKEAATFIIASFIGLLAMCMSYQASNGIYIILSIFFVVKMFKDKESWRQIGKFIIMALACYVVSLVFFKLAFMGNDYNPGRLDERMHADNIIKNVVHYVTLVWQGLGNSGLKALILLSLLLNLFIQPYFSKRNKLLSFCIMILFYVFAIPLSYGAYLAMNLPLWHPRGMFGIGFFIALVSLMLFYASSNLHSIPRKIVSFVIFGISYCCIAFGFAFGNAQFRQNQYAEYRLRLIANDLSKIIPIEKQNEIFDISFTNEVDFAPTVKNLIRTYPLAIDCIDKYASLGECNLDILKSLGFLYFGADKMEVETLCEELPILLETTFHVIRGRGNVYVVTYKNAPIEITD